LTDKLNFDKNLYHAKFLRDIIMNPTKTEEFPHHLVAYLEHLRSAVEKFEHLTKYLEYLRNATDVKKFQHLTEYLEHLRRTGKNPPEAKEGFIALQDSLTAAMDPHGIIEHAVRETGITDPEALANYINETILEDLKSFGIHARIDPRSDQIAFTINGKHAMYYPSDLLALTKSEDTDNNNKIQTLRTQEAIAWKNRIEALAGSR
jgi:hypothetical protein